MTTNFAFLRIKSVQELTGLARSTIYKMMAEDGFPKPVKPTPRVSAWVKSEIEGWMLARVEARNLAH